MILECCSKSLLCVCHLPARTCVPVQGDLGFRRSLPIPGMLRQTLSRWCLNTGMGGKGRGLSSRGHSEQTGSLRHRVPAGVCPPPWSLQDVIPEGCAAAAPWADTNTWSDGEEGTWEFPAPPRDLLLGSSSSPCCGNDPAGTRMELCSPALGSWLPQGHRDEASGHPTRILLSTSRCQRGENQNHPEMLCWATRGVVSQPCFPHPVRGRSCSSPSPWMDLSVGSLKTRKKSQFSAPLEPLRVLILLLWVLLPRSWWGCAVPWAIPGLGFPSTSWEWSAAVARGHIPFLGGKLLG